MRAHEASSRMRKSGWSARAVSRAPISHRAFRAALPARAFSLAEMMIALVILGLGLLFIAAALPAGLEYSRSTVDTAAADEAVQHAMETVLQGLRTSRALTSDPSEPVVAIGATKPPARAALYTVGSARRRDGIFRPRMNLPDATYPLYRPLLRAPAIPPPTISPAPPAAQVPPLDYEPKIKVRPLTLGNMAMTSNPPRGTKIVDDGESLIQLYVQTVAVFVPPPDWLPEYDLSPGDSLAGASPWFGLLQNPPFSGVTRVFPPIEPRAPFRPEDFFNDAPEYRTFAVRSAADDVSGDLLLDGETIGERLKAIERRVGWTAFYRRVAYTARTLHDPSSATVGDEYYYFEPADALTYEVIIVVTRRATVNHRFAAQRIDDGAVASTFSDPQAVNPATIGSDDLSRHRGADRALPTPWLVTFSGARTSLPIPNDTTAPYAYDVTLSRLDTASDRVLNPDPAAFTPPPKLTFVCSPALDGLLPVGSIVIPAANDDYNWAPLTRQAGFVPHVPAQLPIYEVIERPDATTVIVKNNGVYPWVAPTAGAIDFPVWIIPPSFAERDATGQPVYDRRSPIVSVQRRIVRLPEVQ